MKSGFVGIVGRPNVGKSTLLNSIIGEKVAITTSKPQTTRNTIRGIYNDKDLQMVFIDTPGIHKPKNALGSQMTQSALRTFKEVDLILLMVDGHPSEGPGDPFILNMLKDVKTPKFLVINKIDLIPPDVYEQIYLEYESTGIFKEIIGISAKSGKNVDVLLNKAVSYMGEGPQYFPSDMVYDYDETFMVTEIIREKALMYLEEEIPHGIFVELEIYEEKGDLLHIGAVIYCEKKSHKGIIIGKGGRKLKGIGKDARLELEGLLGIRIFLELFVKVKENWRSEDITVKKMGFSDS